MADVLLWSAILIGLLMGGWLVVSYVKKRLTRDDETMGAGFTLSDLRALHRAGRMTDEELDRAKQVVVGNIRKNTQPKPPAEKPTGMPGSDQSV